MARDMRKAPGAQAPRTGKALIGVRLSRVLPRSVLEMITGGETRAVANPTDPGPPPLITG